MSDLDTTRQILDLQRRIGVLETVERIASSSGTWTPVFSGSGTAGTFTYTTQRGDYRRIGDLIYVSGRVTISAIAVAPTGTMRITGLPFTSFNVSGVFGVVAFGLTNQFNYAAASLGLQGIISPNTSLIDLWETFDNAASAQAPAANFTNVNCDLIFSGWYYG